MKPVPAFVISRCHERSTGRHRSSHFVRSRSLASAMKPAAYALVTASECATTTDSGSELCVKFAYHCCETGGRWSGMSDRNATATNVVPVGGELPNGCR